MKAAQDEVKVKGYFAGNQWREAEGKKVFEVREPYSGQLFARVPAGNRTDARVAVDAAAKAFPEWANTTPTERARLFLKAAEIDRYRDVANFCSGVGDVMSIRCGIRAGEACTILVRSGRAF